MGPRDLLGLHEYWVDHRDIENPWHAGRWRIVPRLRDVPIVVTECGRDVVEGRGQAGWQRTCGAGEILADLHRYAAIIAEAPNVWGVRVPRWAPRPKWPRST